MFTCERDATPAASNIETRLSAIQPSRFLEVALENGLIAGIGRLITLSLTFCQFKGRNWFFERQVAFTIAACRGRRAAPFLSREETFA